jgi:HSP20 family molecular chaperone IbpA
MYLTVNTFFVLLAAPLLPVPVTAWGLLPRPSSGLFGPSLFDDLFFSSPASELMMREMDIGPRMGRRRPAAATPYYEIKNTDSDIRIMVDLPGVRAENIDLKVDNERNVLSISGRRENTTSENGAGFSSYISSHQFSNSWTLPSEMVVDNRRRLP